MTDSLAEHLAARAVVEEALRRGLLSEESLREALLLQDELRRAGQPADLLPLLRHRLPAEAIPELTRVYRSRLGPESGSGSDGAAAPLPAAPAPPPAELLARSRERSRRPASEDPIEVREQLSASGERARAGALDHSLVRTAQGGSERLGPYRVLGELARGGMGIVYRAWDERLRRQVALKVLRDPLDEQGEELDRFLAEARAAARLRHPGIVGVHEVGCAGGRHFIAMDLLEGRSLKEQLDVDGPLAPARAAEVTLHLARALAYAHEQGLLHRDVKPGNVLLGRDGSPCLTDFGLVKEVGAERELTATGQVMGTPGYMPPEQVKGVKGELGPWSDVYGLGATLYAMLTGRAPFKADNALAVLDQVVHQEPVPPRARRRDVPPDLEAICLKCLEKDGPRRYPDARTLAEDLERFLRQEPVLARRPGLLSRGARWLRRNRPLVTGVALGAALVAAAGVGVLRWRAGAAAEAREEARRARQADLEGVLTRLERRELDERAAVRELVRLGSDDGRPWLCARLDALTAVLADEQRAAYASAPGGGALRAALEAWLAGEPQTTPQRALLAQAAQALDPGGGAEGNAERRLLERVGHAQAIRLGAGLGHGRVLGEALASLRDAAAVPSLVRFVRAECDPYRATPAALGLLELATPDRAGPLTDELRLRFGEDSSLWKEVRQGRLRAGGSEGTQDRALAGLLAQAEASLEAGQHQAAAEYARRATEIAPGNPQAWATIALARLEEEDWEGAAVAADLALEGDPRNTRALRAQAQALARRGDRAGELAALDAAVSADPQDVRNLVARSEARRHQGLRAEALADAQLAVNQFPLESRSWSARGAVRFDQGDLSGALADYERALELAPGVASYLSNRGMILCQLRRTEEGERDLGRAVALARTPRTRADYLVQRATIRLQAGQLAGAREDAAAALQLDPKRAQAWFLLGVVQLQDGDAEEGTRSLDRALALDGRLADALLIRAQLRMQSDDRAGALADLDLACEQPSHRARAVFMRGHLRLQDGHLDDAVRDLQEALRLEPGMGEAWTSLGDALRRGGQPALALNCYAEAIKRSGLARAKRAQAELLGQLGTPEAAAAAWAQLLESGSDEPGAWRELGHALLRAERADLAAASYREALKRDPKDLEAAAGLIRADPGCSPEAQLALLGGAEDGMAWLRRAALRLVGQELEGAASDLDRARQLLGGFPAEAELLQARVELGRGRKAEAGQALARARATRPTREVAAELERLQRQLAE